MWGWMKGLILSFSSSSREGEEGSVGSHSDTFHTANSQEGDEVMRRGDEGEMEGFVYVEGR